MDLFTEEEWLEIKNSRFDTKPDYSDLFPDLDKPEEFYIPGGRGYQPLGGVLPNAPLYRDPFGVAVFSSYQIQWGKPEDFGFNEEYIIIEDEYDSHPQTLEWNDEKKLPKRRPVHRYSRLERFKSIVNHMMVMHGDVPEWVMDAIRPHISAMRLMDEEIIWDFTRSILKKLKKGRKYYNRIPLILARLKIMPFKFKQAEDVHESILDDFICLTEVWKRADTGRKYFINFRYVCLRLMERHGLSHPYSIPLLRTNRKKTALDQIYEHLWGLVQEDLDS